MSGLAEPCSEVCVVCSPPATSLLGLVLSPPCVCQPASLSSLFFFMCVSAGDAFGVLPPVSKLTLPQTMFHFISGYTALVAGTEDGIKEPQATFSACFGAAFIMWHPTKYAEMLAAKMEKHGATAWLVNTGWSGGRSVARAGLSGWGRLLVLLCLRTLAMRVVPCKSGIPAGMMG